MAISLIGGFELSGDSGRWRPRSLKGQALIAYLALKSEKRESRDKIVGLLWSESRNDKTRVALRQVLANLRKDAFSAHVSLLDCSQSSVAFDPDLQIITDIAELSETLSSGRVPQVLVERSDILNGFLSAFDDIDQSFSLWAQIERQAWIEKISGQLSGLALSASDDTATAAARALLNIDRTNEVACRTLMAKLRAAGDTGGALRAYADLWACLDEEFDVEPSEETQALVVSIKSDSPDATDLASAVPATTVLPAKRVKILVHSLDTGHCSEKTKTRLIGIRHAVISALVCFRDWSVREFDAARESPPAADAGKIYDLIFLPDNTNQEESLFIAGRRCADKQHIWGDRFAITARDWGEFRKQLVRKVAQMLNVQISEDRLARTMAPGGAELDVYDEWLRAQNLMFHWDIESERTAEAILRSILDERPDFATANAGLAQILNSRHLIFPGIFRDADREEMAHIYARKASRLAPLDNRTQLTLAWSYLLTNRFDQAEIQFQLALRLNDNDPWTLCSAAQGLSYCGLHAEARSLADSALEIGFGLAPIHWAYQGFVRYLAGDFEGALEATRKTDDTIFFVSAIMAAAHAKSGDTERAHDIVYRLYARVRDNWFGANRAEPQDVFNWLVQLFPIKHPEDRIRFREGLIASGLLDLVPS